MCARLFFRVQGLKTEAPWNLQKDPTASYSERRRIVALYGVVAYGMRRACPLDYMIAGTDRGDGRRKKMSRGYWGMICDQSR